MRITKVRYKAIRLQKIQTQAIMVLEIFTTMGGHTQFGSKELNGDL